MLTNLFQTMTSLFCCHEWARRRDSNRVYLECVHCLATTPGIEIGHTSAPASPRLTKSFEVVEA
jgi:hypothetical protein